MQNQVEFRTESGRLAPYAGMSDADLDDFEQWAEEVEKEWRVSPAWVLAAIVIIVLALLAGCVSVQPEQFTGPNGKAAYTVGCSGQRKTIADCYRTVARLCPNGYHVLSEAQVAQQIDVDFAMMRRALTVECK